MEIKVVTKKQVIDDLVKEFNITNESLSRCFGGKFYIHKKEFERYETIDKLRKYFEDKTIKDGQCSVQPITLVFTTFSIEDRKL